MSDYTDAWYDGYHAALDEVAKTRPKHAARLLAQLRARDDGPDVPSPKLQWGSLPDYLSSSRRVRLSRTLIANAPQLLRRLSMGEPIDYVAQVFCLPVDVITSLTHVGLCPPKEDELEWAHTVLKGAGE